MTSVLSSTTSGAPTARLNAAGDVDGNLQLPEIPPASGTQESDIN